MFKGYAECQTASSKNDGTAISGGSGSSCSKSNNKLILS